MNNARCCGRYLLNSNYNYLYYFLSVKDTL